MCTCNLLHNIFNTLILYNRGCSITDYCPICSLFLIDIFIISFSDVFFRKVILQMFYLYIIFFINFISQILPMGQNFPYNVISLMCYKVYKEEG